jgi:very-short-patch-repair endonuclease
VFSHASAALLWGLPLFRLPERTHVLVPTARAGDAATDVARHHLGRPPEEVVERRGLGTTGLEQTVVDCARSLGARGGLVVADAALAAGARRDVLDAILAAARGGRGVRCAREVLASADDGAESPGETLARWALLRAGLPGPVTQLPIETHLGVFWADLGWPELGLVAEYDGVEKYKGGATAAVIAEKRRQDAIVEAGWRVVRLTAADVRDPLALGRRLRPRLPAGLLRPRRHLAD